MDAHIKSNFRHILVVYSHLKPVNKSYAALFATETLVISYESNMTVRWLFPLTSQKVAIENVIIIQQILEIAEEKQFL